MIATFTSLILVSLIYALVRGDSLRGNEGNNEACRAVTTTAQLLNGAHKSFIFRCRPGDDCGGVGDRFGGVIGGAFYSFLQGRTFRILWPGLEHVFTPNSLNWTFSPTALKIPYYDTKGVEIDKTRIVNNLGNLIYTDVVSSEVGVVNDLNSRQITNQTAVEIIEKYKHLYFHSNRGPNEEMYMAVAKKNNWPMTGPTIEKSYAAAFLCTFEAMFRPAESFLKTQYKSLGREPMLFAHLMKIVEDPEILTVSLHHRVDDFAAATNSNADTVSDDSISRIIEILAKHRGAYKKANFFFISNSVASMHKVMASTALMAVFGEVYCQELSAQIHVGDADRGGHANHANHPAVLSTQQAFRDWWIMRQSDVLIGGQSGFSKSAALFAAASQVRYEDEGNAYRPNYWVMCGNRFC